MGWGSALKSVVLRVAPTIGTALGGPVGGMASKFLAEQLLGKPDATEAEIEEFILGASPEQMLELKKLDQAFEAQMRALDIDVVRIEMEDRKSARGLFATNIWPQVILTAIFTAGYFVALIMLLRGTVAIPEETQGVVNVVVGVLTAGMSTILAFWFGSSLGSMQKSRDLVEVTRK